MFTTPAIAIRTFAKLCNLLSDVRLHFFSSLVSRLASSYFFNSMFLQFHNKSSISQSLLPLNIHSHSSSPHPRHSRYCRMLSFAVTLVFVEMRCKSIHCHSVINDCNLFCKMCVPFRYATLCVCERMRTKIYFDSHKSSWMCLCVSLPVFIRILLLVAGKALSAPTGNAR